MRAGGSRQRCPALCTKFLIVCVLLTLRPEACKRLNIKTLACKRQNITIKLLATTKLFLLFKAVTICD